MRKLEPLITCLIVGVLVLSCSDDDNNQVVAPKSLYADLTEMDDVLFNLELAYNNRDADEVDRLLDDSFVFHFAQRDLPQVGSPTLTRAQEMNATGNLFNPAFSKPGVDPIIEIDMTITYAVGNWTPVPASKEQTQIVEEQKYQKIIDYFSIFDAPPNTFTSQKTLQAIITIQQFELDGKMVWRIVEWKDDIGSDAMLNFTNGTFILARTWGAVKELYKDI